MLELVAIAALALASASGDEDFFGQTNDADVGITASRAYDQGAPSSSNPGRPERWLRAALCVGGSYRYDETSTPECFTESQEIVRYCDDGTRALNPWWRQYHIAGTTWSNWEVMSGYQCTVDIIAELAAREFASMPIAPNVIRVQPPDGWTITTVPTIFYVDRAPRTMGVVLLGRDVIIRALPQSYRWTWGDGDRTTTSSPGAPYPNQSVTHTYMYEEQDVTVRLTTTWAGSFSLDGGSTWIDAPGTATTVSVPVDLHVYNPHSHQVDCDLYTTCLHP